MSSSRDRSCPRMKKNHLHKDSPREAEMKNVSSRTRLQFFGLSFPWRLFTWNFPSRDVNLSPCMDKPCK